ncbi:hypothetical protein GCM10007424_18160 [Flavobacterium suaedae]|uniref:DUF2975 domain-containing protein n=1 Tax=Flavobacterium suaedae TaxID=1767027 RepID=A0ABQ1JUF1_9FLAO|nr:DUF2975 domain-containing protein [Flavobacterium suaedae]GGB78404.1 hypothetical protein GCM10007424_18160 [Flavobacterium suaedae]
MRRLSTLKTIVDILFVFAMIAVIFGLPLILMLIIIPEQVPITFSEGRSPSGIDFIGFLFFIYVGYLFFVYALYLFRKTLELFRKRIFFDNRVIKNLDQTGKAILIGVVIMIIPAILLRLTESPIELEVNIGLNDTLITAGLGLFFIVLSDVFAMAKKHKEDSDLTV